MLATPANPRARYQVTIMIIAVRQEGPARFGVFLN